MHVFTCKNVYKLMCMCVCMIDLCDMHKMKNDIDRIDNTILMLTSTAVTKNKAKQV